MKQVLRIPSSFELHGMTYNIKMLDNLAAEDDRAGEIAYRYNEIRIQNVMKGVSIDENRQGQVFCHELVHAILDEMQSKLRSDETFVDLFGSLLHQALITCAYSFKK
jgi:hypothetical protein